MCAAMMSQSCAATEWHDVNPWMGSILPSLGRHPVHADKVEAPHLLQLYVSCLEEAARAVLPV